MIHAGKSMTLLDAHWAPKDGAGWKAFVSQHIPNSLFCPPEMALTSTPSRAKGRNPLPTPNAFQTWLRKWGIDGRRPVVVYGNGDGLYAARTWWTLRWAGVTDVRILDGGIDEWERCGYRVLAGPGTLPTRGCMEIQPYSMPTADTDEVQKWIADGGLLLDCRSERRFQGLAERMDFQAGHIPDAINLPVFSLRDEYKRVLPPEEIRQRFADIGVTDPTKLCVYSGSNLHAALMLAIMEYAGLSGATLYEGGWSQWAGDVTRQIARTTY